jgi:hypothetical protein
LLPKKEQLKKKKIAQFVGLQLGENLFLPILSPKPNPKKKFQPITYLQVCFVVQKFW